MASRLPFHLLFPLLFPFLASGSGKYHAALGFTNSKGLFSMGHGGDKDLVAVGLQQLHSVGEAYCFLPFLGYQRALQAGHSPYLSVTYNSLYATQTDAKFSIDGLDVEPGWNPGHLSGNMGYRLRYSRINLEAEIGGRTPLSSRFTRSWSFDFGAGISLPFPLW